LLRDIILETCALMALENPQHERQRRKTTMHAGIIKSCILLPIAKRHHPETCALIALEIPSLKAKGEKQQCTLIPNI